MTAETSRDCYLLGKVTPEVKAKLERAVEASSMPSRSAFVRPALVEVAEQVLADEADLQKLLKFKPIGEPRAADLPLYLRPLEGRRVKKAAAQLHLSLSTFIAIAARKKLGLKVEVQP